MTLRWRNFAPGAMAEAPVTPSASTCSKLESWPDQPTALLRLHREPSRLALAGPVSADGRPLSGSLGSRRKTAARCTIITIATSRVAARAPPCSGSATGS